jgi:cellulose biosynthesis protein BcsQ
MQPSGMDYGHAMDTQDLAKKLNIESKFSINRYRSGTKDSQEILKSFGNNGFKNYFTLLVDFVAAENHGLYIGNYKPNGKAHKEAKNFANEVIQWVEKKQCQ